jgi:hypothetical protein
LSIFLKRQSGNPRGRYAELQYRVLIDDNAQYMDESERAAHGVFGSATFAR